MALRGRGLAGPLLGFGCGLLGDPAPEPIDMWGVPADHVPGGKVWVSQDIWRDLPDKAFPTTPLYFGGKRGQMRLAFPAVDMRNVLDIPALAPIFKTQHNPKQDGYEWYLGSDDMRWDLHAPTEDNRVLLSWAPPQFWHRQGFQKWPADFWRLDLDPGLPEWFPPWGIPIDAFDAVAAGALPDNAFDLINVGNGVMATQPTTLTPEAWWDREYSLFRFTSLGTSDKLGAGLAPAAGAITFYRPSDIPTVSGGTIELGPIGTMAQEPQQPPTVGTPVSDGEGGFIDPLTEEYYPDSLAIDDSMSPASTGETLQLPPADAQPYYEEEYFEEEPAVEEVYFEDEEPAFEEEYLEDGQEEVYFEDEEPAFEEEAFFDEDAEEEYFEDADEYADGDGW